MTYFLFGGEPNADAKGADSFLGVFPSLESARRWFEEMPERDPLTQVEWGQIAAWDGHVLRIVAAATPIRTYHGWKKMPEGYVLVVTSDGWRWDEVVRE